MIYFNNRTPLPDGMYVEAALACASDYLKYHSLIATEIANKLSQDDFESLKEKSQETIIFLGKLGLCINAEYVAEVRTKYHERVANSKRNLVIFLLGLGICAALSLVLTAYVTSFLAVGVLAHYLYWDHIKELNLSSVDSKLEDRRRERRHAELDLQAVCRNCRERNAQDLATIKLYLDDPYGAWVHPGQIDPSRRPDNQRPIPPAKSEDSISYFGANFEDPNDPRIPEFADQIIVTKIMLALIPVDLEHDVCEAFQDKYSYMPSIFWDYFDFQRDWHDGGVPKLW